ncbi:hypothetical protein OZX72_09015 [Bifidobacterium sp. ESL0769]|uniref:hypothetical protein n=1 Tax=Bifidobacterium sp. ESL0769 TaxID=2983229 RepID=UPI0023FA3A72|nr:hypothetical protein [Bifidobacterium sp. ESL0769]WEV67356.1 hypothetical protein OZX72_09015 [Bifidobacterium sp. ESL0769]
MAKARQAWGDESVRMHDNLSRYMIGISLCDLEEKAVREEFKAHKLLKGNRKAHHTSPASSKRHRPHILSKITA